MAKWKKSGVCASHNLPKLWWEFLLLERWSVCWNEAEVQLPYRYKTGNGPLARYVKLRVVHAPGMPGTSSPPPTSNEVASWRSRHASRHVRHARAVMHFGIAKRRWWGKCSRHSRRMPNPKIYVSDKRPMELLTQGLRGRLMCTTKIKIINSVC